PALARLQAAAPGWVVSGMRHVAMDLDAPARELLGLLDGEHTLDDLSTHMQARLKRGGLDLPWAQIDAMTQQQVWRFARQGLLAG
ncbi:MAG: hypothetical protein ACLGG4_05870, partial [Gammaproteobacteria bacterium]